MSTTRIGDRLAAYRVSQACAWCLHPKSLHRDGRVCEAQGCRCLRVGDRPPAA